MAQVAPADRLPLASRAALEVHWVDRAGDLPARVQALPLPPGEGFTWGGGEASAMARLRAVLRERHQLPKEAMRIVAYWKQGASQHHENLED